MAGRRELGFPKAGVYSLREQAARMTLRKVRLEGHTYVEVREDGKRLIFFCTLCLAPCYSDSALFDHLKGNLHKERYAVAKVTLLGPNPWPFNDGVLFFHDCSEEDKHVAGSMLLNSNINDNNLTVVSHGKNSNTNGNGHASLEGVGHNKNSDSRKCVMSSSCKSLIKDGVNQNMIIPGVVCKDEISSLEVRFIGFGEVTARIHESAEIPNKINRMWCAWLGKCNSNDESVFMLPVYDFGIVSFAYNYSLGRRGVLNDFSPLLASSPSSDIENVEGTRKKRKKSFSNPEDISKSLSDQCDYSGEDDLVSDNHISNMVLDRYDDESQHARFIPSKSVRRELRRQQRLAAERICDICQHKILPGKDVSTLLNMNTGRLACSSRNVNGAFHLFHTSCLIHWILLCEFEIWTNQSASPKIKHRSRRKNVSKRSEMLMNDKRRITSPQISSVFCPECQGTGINIKEDQLEKPTIPLSEMFNYKIKAIDAHRAWMKDPEILETCSTGLHFPRSSEETIQERVFPLKLLHFYRADE